MLRPESWTGLPAGTAAGAASRSSLKGGGLIAVGKRQRVGNSGVARISVISTDEIHRSIGILCPILLMNQCRDLCAGQAVQSTEERIT
jgi:hypothetical protein